MVLFEIHALSIKMANNGDLDNPSISDVKNCLKEAGSYDVNMSEKEMLEMYHVLRYSRNTANEEDERRIQQRQQAFEMLRRNSVSVHKNNDYDSSDEFTSKDADNPITTPFLSNLKRFDYNKEKQSDSNQKVFDFEEELPTTSVAAKYTQKEKNEAMIDVFNCVPTQHKPLKQISVNPQYNSPFYCNKELVNKGYKERARMILSYHTALHRIYDDYQKHSVHSAPWGKPIQQTSRFNGNLSRKVDKTEKIEKFADFAQDDYNITDKYNNQESTNNLYTDDFEPYVSKSGRLTKRRLYTENVDEDDDDDDEESHKKNKLAITEMNNDSDVEWFAKSKPSVNSNNTDPKKFQPKKRKGIGSISNEEIMKRSKLFGNTDTSNSRTEKMFQKLVENNNKKKKEVELLKLHDSFLDSSDDEEKVSRDVDEDIAEIAHAEEPFTRRRIIPPSHGNKAGKGKSTVKGRGKRSNKSPIEESDSQELHSSKYQRLEASSSKTVNVSKKKSRCPICNEEFLQSELVEHASTCIDSYSEKSARSNSSSFCENRITCDTCDQVLPLDANYEVHVRECIVKQMKQKNVSS